MMANLPTFEKSGIHAATAVIGTLLLALCGGACGGGAAAHGAPPQPPRATPGTSAAPATAPTQARPRRPRPFVSPHSYEWFIRAELLAARGDHAAAVEAYRTALGGAEEDPHVLSRLALALEAAGDRHGADRALTHALAIDARSESAWLARARVAEGRGALPEALHALERAEAAAPRQQQAPRQMARLLTEAGQPERALAVRARQAARLPAGSPQAARVALELALLRRDGPALEGAAQRWLASAGGGERMLRQTIARLLASGNVALALRVARVLPPTPDNAPQHLQVLLAAGQTARAEAMLALTPPRALGGPLELARAHLGVQRPDRALSLIEDTTVGPGEHHLQALLRGEALLRLGRTDEALRALSGIPADSLQATRARQLVAEAATALGRPSLAAELAGGPAQ